MVVMGVLDDVYGGSWIKAETLDGETPVTIAGWRIHEFEDGKKQVALELAEYDDKELGLNATNKNMVVEMHGDDPDKWVGKSIVLFKDKTDFGGKLVNCVRIRYKADNTPAPAALASKTGTFGEKECKAEFKRAFGKESPKADYLKAFKTMDEGKDGEWTEADWRALADMAEGLSLPF